MPPFWTIGCLYGASSVLLGAFGAHGLKKRIADPARLANWSTAAQYQVRTARAIRIAVSTPIHAVLLYDILGAVPPLRILPNTTDTDCASPTLPSPLLASPAPPFRRL